MARAEQGWRANPQIGAAAYAQLLFQSGDFWSAWQVVRPLAETWEVSTDALRLAGRLAYMLGHYDAAERYLKTLTDSLGPAATTQEMNYLILTYYQQNRFDRIAAMAAPAATERPLMQLIRTFQERPYQLDWTGPSRISTVPLLATDPLPSFTMEINGRPVTVGFDTGADILVLDADLAEALGAKPFVAFGAYDPDGPGARSGMSRVDSIRIGDVTIRHVPVLVAPIRRSAGLRQDRRIVLGGIVGTALLRQFVSTLDFTGGRIVLRERGTAGARDARAALPRGIAAEIPFALDSTHVMLTRGRINGSGDLTFFVDSGQTRGRDNQMMTAPIQTLRHLAIPEPGPAATQAEVSPGPSAPVSFHINSVHLGPLVQTDVSGEFGARSAETYWRGGYILDGVICHGFLRKYSSWTIDFDSMSYIVGR
ncbi:MAG: retropepsin-like domain-containing protein [Rhizobiales bacterium]|nr:retropepsin-like domain-containing protein [Hyphomicrobiales bacterium]